jgi:hypothetical protein
MSYQYGYLPNNSVENLGNNLVRFSLQASGVSLIIKISIAIAIIIIILFIAIILIIGGRVSSTRGYNIPNASIQPTNR